MPDQPDVPEMGYPDTGNGVYIKGLGYETWYNFGNAMRVECNFQEQIMYILTAAFVIALTNPKVAYIMTGVWFVARTLFSVMYNRCGPKARLPGALIMDVVYLASLYYQF